MNIEHLRKSLKAQWLGYYRTNRDWLTRLGVWVNCEGKRRPSSSFILGTLSILEPQLTQLLPLVVDLSSNPDRIVIALGLNFNPDDELEALAKAEKLPSSAAQKMLPSGASNPFKLSENNLSENNSSAKLAEQPSKPAEQPPKLAEQPPPQRVIDSAELSVKEQPDREVANTDEACQGVRNVPKTRWD